MAPFILKPYLTAGDLELWIAFSDVCYSHACILTRTYTCLLNVYVFFRYSAYATLPHCLSDHDTRVRTVRHFIHCVQHVAPEMLQKLKVHLLLHLPDNILDFVPPANYNYIYPMCSLRTLLFYEECVSFSIDVNPSTAWCEGLMSMAHANHQART